MRDIVIFFLILYILLVAVCTYELAGKSMIPCYIIAMPIPP